MPLSRAKASNWLQRRIFWISLVIITVGLGAWGFAVVPSMPPGPAPTPMEVLYRTARLFTLNLDVDKGVEAPPQLWVAAVLAPLLVLRGFAELFRNRARRDGALRRVAEGGGVWRGRRGDRNRPSCPA